MTGPRQAGECYQALAVAEDLPYGSSRTALVEEVVAEADALGDRALAVEARLDLISAYSYGGEPLKRRPVFDWLLARHDEVPFDGAHRRRLLWQYKWLTTGVLEQPDVELPVILDTLEDMERRYRDAGEGLAPVLGCRYQVMAHVRGADAAEDEYRAWVAARRTHLSDCRACEPTARVRHLAQVGRDEAAVAEALPVLAGEVDCTDQPASMIAVALPSLLLTGHAARAATEHLRGVRQTRHDPSGTLNWAHHLDVLTRSGRLQRALDLLAERLDDLDAPPTPGAGMRLAAAAAALCERLVARGWGEQVLTPAWTSTSASASAPVAVADLVGPLREHALALAARFDARNGTDVIGLEIAGWLDPAPLPDLPLDLLPDATAPVRTGRRAAPADAEGPRAPWPAPATPSGGLPVQPAPSPQPSAPQRHASPGSLEALAADLERARQSGDRQLRVATLRAWRVGRDQLLVAEPTRATAPPWDPADADRQRALDVARLDCAAALDDLEHDPTLLHATRALGARLHDAGDEAGAYRFELWWLREAVGAGLMSPDDAIRAAEDVVAEMRTGISAADQGTAYLALLALLHVVAEQGRAGQATRARQGRVLQAGLQALAGVDVAHLDGYQRGCYALLLRLNAAQSPPAERASILLQALLLLPAGVRRGERALIAVDLAALHADDGERELALGLLAEAEPDAVAAGDPGLACHAAMLSAGLLAADGEWAEAVAAARRGVDSAERGSDPAALDRARHLLVHTLRDAGRTLEAADVAELALRETTQRLLAEGVLPAAGDDAPSGPPRGDVHVAGALAWAAAVCAEDLGEPPQAHAHALTSAAWHARNGSHAARAEALEVAARTAGSAEEAAQAYGAAADAYDEAGEPWPAAGCRRARAFPLAELHGVAAALQSLDEAHLALDVRCGPDGADPDADEPASQRRAEWEHVALVEQAARVLAQDGQYGEALELTESLAARYRHLGDLPSAWDVAALRARLFAEVARPDAGLAALDDAAAEAADLDPDRGRGLAELLATLLHTIGDVDAAAAVRGRFGLA